MMTDNAWCSLLLTQDYLEAILVLNKSIKKTKSIYPFVCMCPQELLTPEIEQILLSEKIKIEVIEKIQSSESALEYFRKNNLSKDFYNDSKINIFNLKHYKKLCFLDADGIILQNIDNVFEKYKDGSTICYSDPIFCFSIVTPKNHQFYIHKILVENTKQSWDYVFADLAFYTRENKEYSISTEYYMPFSPALPLPISYIKGIHFISIKPWKKEEQWFLQNKDNKVIEKYHCFLKMIRKKYDTEKYTFNK